MNTYFSKTLLTLIIVLSVAVIHFDYKRKQPKDVSYKNNVFLIKAIGEPPFDEAVYVFIDDSLKDLRRSNMPLDEEFTYKTMESCVAALELLKKQNIYYNPKHPDQFKTSCHSGDEVLQEIKLSKENN